MSPVPPSKVKDKSKRTLIFDWRVPIAVGASNGAVAGQLYWTPNASSAPVATIVIGALIVVFGLLLVVFVRRRGQRRARQAPVRRRRSPVAGEQEQTGYREAW